MPTDSPDARVLLDVPPDQYVTERTRLVKEAKANRDKERATFFQSLKRPSVALWAVLSVGVADDVHKVLAATTELGKVQAGGTDSASLSAATQRRRKVLESYVADAVKGLAKVDPGAEKRRPEIRALLDQLSRHPELSSAWIDGTLRELPDSEFGFGAFDGMDISVATKPPAETKTKTSSKAKRSPEPALEPPEPVRDLAAERAARAARTEAARQAKKAVVEAAREVTAAEKLVTVARAAVRDAEKQLATAERQHAAARRRHETAVANRESLR